MDGIISAIPFGHKNTRREWETKWNTCCLGHQINKILELGAIMKIDSFSCEEWEDLYEEDSNFSAIYQQASSHKSHEEGWKPDFYIQVGLLYKLGNICISKEGNQIQFIREAHTSNIVGHFGWEKTLAFLKRYVDWPSMDQDVARYVHGCTLHSISKPMNRVRIVYTPLPTPSRPWERISMDFLGSFPRMEWEWLYSCDDR